MGEAGDWIGVYVANASNNKYKPYAIRAANAVTKSPLIDYSSANGKVINSGLYKFVADSWESVWPEVKEADFKSPSITSVAALSSSTTPVKWVKGPNCGGGKWLSPMACYGIWKPWAAGPSVEPSSTKGGSFQMFHWLADKNPKDPSLVFQIEADATVTLLVNEHIGPWPEDINLRVGDGFKRTYASTAPYATTGTTWYDAPGTDAADNGYSLICKGASGALNSFDAMDYWGYGYFTFEAASGLLSTTAFAATLAALTLF